MKYIYLSLIILSSLQSFSQKKSTNKKKTKSLLEYSISIDQYMDNPSKYYKKVVQINRVFYYSRHNSGMGLRSGNENYEQLLSSSLGFYENNDSLHTRRVGGSDGTLYMRIPIEQHNTLEAFPNIVDSGYITITGVPLEDNMIVVVAASRM